MIMSTFLLVKSNVKERFNLLNRYLQGKTFFNELFRPELAVLPIKVINVTMKSVKSGNSGLTVQNKITASCCLVAIDQKKESTQSIPEAGVLFAPFVVCCLPNPPFPTFYSPLPCSLGRRRALLQTEIPFPRSNAFYFGNILVLVELSGFPPLENESLDSSPNKW